MRLRKQQVIKAIADHSEELRSLDVRALYLFGSVVRDEATEDSDVDVQVEFSTTPDFDRYINLKFYLEDLLHVPVDLMTRASVRPEIAAHINKEAIRVA